MRPLFYVIAIAACVTTGFALALARAEKAPSAPPAPPAIAAQAGATNPPTSLVGHKVRVYFRGSDDISFPNMRGSEVHLAMKLTYLSGQVRQVQPGWVELSNVEKPGEPNAWVPASSIAYVLADEDPPGGGPATRP